MPIFKEIPNDFRLIKITPGRDRIENTDIFFKSLHSLDLNIAEKHTITMGDKIYKYNLKDGGTVKTKDRFGYYVLITKDDVEYLFMCPTHLLEEVKDKLEKCYSNGEVKILSKESTDLYIKILNSSNGSMPIVSRTNDVYSINTNNSLGKGFYDIKTELKDNEFVALTSTFAKVPSATWRLYVKASRKKLRFSSKDELEKSCTKDCKKNIFTNGLLKLVYLISDSLAGGLVKKDKTTQLLESNEQMENLKKEKESKEKESLPIFRVCTDIRALSCDNKTAKNNINASFIEFSKLDGDNGFGLSNKPCRNDVTKKGFPINSCMLSNKELSAIYKFPTHMDMAELRIKYIRTNQIKLDDSFLDPSDKIFLGYNYQRDKVQMAYMPEDEATIGLMQYIIAPEGAGKTTFLKNVAAFHAMINRGFLNVDFEDGQKLNNGIIKILDYLKKKYVHYDLTGKSSKAINFNTKGKTVTDISFSFDETLPENITEVVDKIKWYRDEGDSKISLCKIVLGISGTFSEEELSIFRASCVLNKLINPAAPLALIFKTIRDQETREVLYEELKNEKYSEFMSILGGFEDELIDLKKLDRNRNLSLPNLENARRLFSSNVLADLYMSTSGHVIDFKQYIKEGMIVLVSLPNDCPQYAINTICMFFYNKVFQATNSFLEIDAIPYSIFIDEIYRLNVALDFLHREIVRFRKRKLRCYITVHHCRQFIGTPFEETFCNTNCHIVLLPGVSKDEFNLLKNIKDSKFTDIDIEELAALASENRKFAMYYIKINGGSNYRLFVAELPQDLSIPQKMEEYKKELKNRKKEVKVEVSHLKEIQKVVACDIQ